MANPYEYGYVDKKKEAIIWFIYPGMKVTGYEDLPELMIGAVDEVKKEIGAEIELHITGMRKESISKWATGKNITIPADVVIYHDWLEYSDLIKLYSKADFLLLARQNNEITRANFPSKVPELMSFGVIPVCSDVGDYTKYYLEDGVNSIIFQPDSYEDCKAAVRRACLLSDEQYSNMRRSARQLVEDKFYYGNWAQQINDFLLGEETEE